MAITPLRLEQLSKQHALDPAILKDDLRQGKNRPGLPQPGGDLRHTGVRRVRNRDQAVLGHEVEHGAEDG